MESTQALTVYLVTGASSGIGYEIALGLARQGVRVLGVGRDRERCRTAEASIRSSSGNPSVDFEITDLSRQAEVRALAARIGNSGVRLKGVIYNAGTFSLTRTMTREGIEQQFAVNYLSGFLLVSVLFPLLDRAPRIVMVSSGSHRSGRIHWRNISLQPLYNGLTAYAQSKLAQVMFIYELARRTEGVADCYAVDPGLVNTEMGFKGTGFIGRTIWGLRSRGGVSPRAAAGPIVDLVLQERFSGRSGLYWKEKQPIPSSMRSYDREDAVRLWNLSERLCHIHFFQKAAVEIRQ